jgi:hypothetical protein
MWDRYNGWASKRLHIHFYAWGWCFDAFGIDLVPIPAPAWLERAMPPRGWWRFSFDS